MTQLGIYLTKRAVTQSKLSKITGISKQRLSDLWILPTSRLTAKELYLISMAIKVDATELLKDLFKDVMILED